MRPIHSLIVAALATIALASITRAAEFTPDGDTLNIDGEIRAGDDRILANLLSAGTIKTISINSPGGDLNAGLRMGELVRKHKLTTSVEAGVREAGSAAAYLFMGGTERLVKGPRGVGVHAFFTPANEVRKMLKQKTTEEMVVVLNEFERRTQEATMSVVEYVTNMIGDIRIVRAAVKTGSESLIWPTATELLDMKVATKIVEYKPEELPDIDWLYGETVTALAAWLDPSHPDPLDDKAREILEKFMADENRGAKLRSDLEDLLTRAAPPSRTVALTRIAQPVADSIAQQARAAARPPESPQ